MTNWVLILSGLALSIATGRAADAAPAEAGLPTALASLQPGLWSLRSRDGSAAPKTICLGDMRLLLQVQHENAVCNRMVISNNPVETVVNYTCAGRGNGRTTVRVETPRVVQIESQGIDGKELFDWTLEGRRTGECAAGNSAARR